MRNLYSHPGECRKIFLANYLCIGFVPGGMAKLPKSRVLWRGWRQNTKGRGWPHHVNCCLRSLGDMWCCHGFTSQRFPAAMVFLHMSWCDTSSCRGLEVHACCNIVQKQGKCSDTIGCLGVRDWNPKRRHVSDSHSLVPNFLEFQKARFLVPTHPGLSALVAPSTGWMLYYLCFSPSTAIGLPVR